MKKTEKEYKKYIKITINKENDWDHMTKGSMVEGPLEKITHEEMPKQ